MDLHTVQGFSFEQDLEFEHPARLESNRIGLGNELQPLAQFRIAQRTKLPVTDNLE